MIIGYDGKRAFQNNTGLGNYSRSLVSILAAYFPDNKYLLFAPKQTSLFSITAMNNVEVHTPQQSFYKKFPALWRRSGVVKDIAASNLDIYHGLSNELPNGIEKTKVRTVVTVHDLIYERFPETYNFDERYTHRWKIKRACKIADAVIAISEQTKEDLVNIYGISANKIFTCYQSCNPIFENLQSESEKEIVKKRYGLPDKYFLFVSSIAPRKNLVTICKALVLLKDKMNIPLVIIGDGKKEKDAVKKLMAENKMNDQLIFLNDLPQAKEIAFTNATDFPAIYQQALALIYPSIFEGFGLPILEAMWSGLPVISSNISSMPEVAGEAALYFAPHEDDTLAKHMFSIATNKTIAGELRAKGFIQAQKFAPFNYAENVMKVYTQLL
ncbi:MAG: glycosyltransferase family 1 protein [Ferruginibacter sp.]